MYDTTKTVNIPQNNFVFNHPEGFPHITLFLCTFRTITVDDSTKLVNCHKDMVTDLIRPQLCLILIFYLLDHMINIKASEE